MSMNLGSYLGGLALAIQDSFDRFNRQYDSQNGTNGTSSDRPPLDYDDFEVYSFPQTWGSTSLGFGGVGGAAMTSAQTVVCTCATTNSAHIYFGGRYAYTANDLNGKFWGCVSSHGMPEVSKRHKLND